jgi:plasmid replication initiation protein
MMGVPTKDLQKKMNSKIEDAPIEDFMFKTLVYFSSPIIKH